MKFIGLLLFTLNVVCVFLMYEEGNFQMLIGNAFVAGVMFPNLFDI